MRKLLIAAIVISFGLPAMGQKIKHEGDFDVLKNKSVFVEFDYSDMSVGKFEKEEDYVVERIAKLNEKEPGTGDKWHKSWIADRKKRFEPKFLELLGSRVGDVSFQTDPEGADFVAIVHTTFTEPGFNVGVARKNSRINLEITFVDAADRENEIGKIFMEKVPGKSPGSFWTGGFDFDTGYRIQEAYAKAGKELEKYLRKKIF